MLQCRSDSDEGDGDGPVDSAASGRAMFHSKFRAMLSCQDGSLDLCRLVVRRSYNYRVVMVCGDAEMDMRPALRVHSIPASCASSAFHAASAHTTSRVVNSPTPRLDVHRLRS